VPFPIVDIGAQTNYTNGTVKGKTLRTLRKKLGWTQVQFAKTIHVTPNTFARWERDERNVTEPMAMLIQTVYANEKKRR
jgi:transcriptional regulator with XRE-family HTH domain